MLLRQVVKVGRRLQGLASHRSRQMKFLRAQALHHIATRTARAALNLDSQMEILWEAVALVARPPGKALLLLCPEWGVLVMARPLGPVRLEPTRVRLTSLLLEWLQTHQTPEVHWREMEVLPQFGEATSPERELFEGIGAEVLVPLRVDDALTGILVLGAKVSGDAYPKEELELLGEVAAAAARGIENARLYAVQLEELSRLQQANDAKSEYILTITHQLKTPIAAVKASAEMLTDSQADSPRFRDRLVNSIVRGIDSLDRLVTELTEYGRMRSATLELQKVESSLGSIVSDTCALLQPLAEEKGLRLNVETPPALPRVMVDPHRVHQILTNLITNAIKFSPTGEDIAVRVTQESDRLVTLVKDNGPGIPQSQQQWVFEAFHGGPEGRRGSGGSGLGLAIAKALTELHGGTIWLESQEAHGSGFYFTLPLRA